MRRLLTLAVACGSITIGAAMAQEKGEHLHSWVAPREADARKNPLPNRPEIVAGGKKVFQERCAACHDDDGTGTARGPNLMTAHVQNQSDGDLFWKISRGNTRTGMPAFSFLPEPQRWQLVMYLRSEAGDGK